MNTDSKETGVRDFEQKATKQNEKHGKMKPVHRAHEKSVYDIVINHFSPWRDKPAQPRSVDWSTGP
jgi:hypothetical protein